MMAHLLPDLILLLQFCSRKEKRTWVDIYAYKCLIVSIHATYEKL